MSDVRAVDEIERREYRKEGKRKNGREEMGEERW